MLHPQKKNQLKKSSVLEEQFLKSFQHLIRKKVEIEIQGS